MKNNKSKATRRRFSTPLVFITVILQLFLSVVLCLALVIYTPFFTTIKKFAVASIMETGSHQYIAKMFFSKAQIASLLDEKNSNPVKPQEISTVTTTKAGDSQIEEFTIAGEQFSGYVLEVSDPLRVNVTMTKFVGKVGEFTSAMAERENAIAAINGGGYQSNSASNTSSSLPSDFVIHGGQVVWKDKKCSDYKEVNVIALDNKGVLVVGNHSINDLLSLHVMEAVTFDSHEPLIINGQPQYIKGEDQSRSPRTAIAQLKDGTILLIALDGRKLGQFGATYYELQQVILDNFSKSNNPVETATILDGGGSTTMYYNGKIINQPSGTYGERAVATAFYVEQ